MVSRVFPNVRGFKLDEIVVPNVTMKVIRIFREQKPFSEGKCFPTKA